MVPPIRLWDAGVPNRAALAIMTRNSRMPGVAGRRPRRRVLGLPDGRAPARRAVRPVRRRDGRVLLRRDHRPHHHDVPPRDPRPDPGRRVGVGGLRRARRRRRADAAHPADHADPHRRPTTRTASGWSSTSTAPRRRPRARSTTAATTATASSSRSGWRRSCATSPRRPERMAELDVNEGIVPLIEMRFPDARHAADAGLPGADQRPHVRDPAAARRARRRGRQGGRRPDAGRPGDDPLHRRVRRGPRRPAVPDARGARRRLRRPLLRRRRGHHPRRPRLAEPADRVHRGALPVPGRVARRWPIDSGGAGQFRGGLGYEKHIRMLKDAHFMSIADRSILACWGVKGGLAGQPFQVTIDPGGPDEREVDALADAEPVAGRRGDPDPHHRRRRLGRPARARPGAGGARRGLAQGLARRRRWPTTAWCSPARSTTTRSATTRTPPPPSGPARPAATEAFFDRGPGYARLAGGAAHAEVDLRG